MRAVCRRWLRLLMTAVMFLPSALGAVAVVIYNALAKQSRALVPNLLPVSTSSPGHPTGGKVELTSAEHVQPAAIHALPAAVHAQASTAQLLFTKLPHSTALPIGNLGGMVPGAKADQRNGSHAFSVKGGQASVRSPGNVMSEFDIQQVAATTRSPSLASLMRREHDNALQAVAAANAEQLRARHQAQQLALAITAAARAAELRAQQQAQDALRALAAAEAAAKQREANLAAQAAAQAAKQREQQLQAFLIAMAEAQKAQAAQQQAALQALAAAQAAKQREQEQAFFQALAARQRAQSAPAPAPVASSTVPAGLPMPIQYLHNGTVDQGVSYNAPGGTPLYAMGSGTIISTGIAGYGPNAPVLQITSGPLAGRTVFYGNAGSNLVPVGAQVVEGQQISTVGYGQVGWSFGPHLDIGFYPPGPMSSGQAMLDHINSIVGYNTGKPPQAVAAPASPAPSPPVAKPVSFQVPSSNLNTRQGFAVALLNALGAPVTSQNLSAVVSWEIQEGGGFGGPAAYNPLNTTLRMPGSRTVTRVGIQAYTSASQGLQATVMTLRSSLYTHIVAALRAGNSAQAVERAVAASQWGTGPFRIVA